MVQGWPPPLRAIRRFARNVPLRSQASRPPVKDHLILSYLILSYLTGHGGRVPQPEARERLLGPGELLGEVGGDPGGDDSLGKKV